MIDMMALSKIRREMILRTNTGEDCDVCHILRG